MRVRLDRPRTAFLLLAALIATLYAPTLDDGWHFDDLAELEWTGAREELPAAPKAHYRGIVTVWTWAANWRISGENAWSYHALNVLIHLVASAAVYMVARELLRQFPSDDPRHRRHVPLVAALLFAAHPLATQSVAYVSQRSTSLAAALTLLALALYLHARRRTVGSSIALLAVALLAYQAALHAKHVALCLPGLLLVIEWLATPAAARPRRTWRVAVIPFAILAAVRATDYAPRHLEPASRLPHDPTPGRWEYLLTQTRAAVAYIKLTLLPIGQNLDHDFRLSRSILDPHVLVSLAILGGLVAVAIAVSRRAPLVTFGILLFLIALLPTSSFVPSRDLLYEHRAYLSLAGFALAAASVLAARGSRLLPAAAVVTLSVLTVARNQVWASELTLWNDAAAKSPSKARPQVNLGLALHSVGRREEAAAQYRRALELDPDSAPARINLANIAHAAGDLGTALRLVDEAIALRPASAEAHLNRGNVLLALGRVEEAEAAYRVVLDMQPRSIVARYNLGKCHEKASHWEKAVHAYEDVVARRPDDPQFVNDLGCAYLAAGRIDDAERTLRRAVESSPGWAVVHHNLALALDAQGRVAEASSERREAARLGLGPVHLDGVGATP